MNSGAPSSPVWRKSSRSGGGNQCVEVARISDARAIRDSRNPEGGHVALRANAYGTLVSRIKNGEFDL
ncbi:DUF397 domain-containing protein [Actinomadura sp. WMMB 499]|nr:DUF397 domain-containing protein [Actinomadura sp. WMMB 499]